MGCGGTPGARPGCVRSAPVRQALSQLSGPLAGSVGLPARMFWPGPNPRTVRWDLADPTRRRDLSEIVLPPWVRAA